MRSRMAPQDEGFVLFDVDNIPISAILRSLFTQEGTLPERSVAGWRGGACAGGVPLRRPGRPPESGLATGSTPRRGEKASACAEACELARPGLRRGRVRERLKARRRRALPYGPAEGDGERRSGGKSLRLCGRWVFVRAGRQGQPCAPDWMEHLPPGRRKLRPKGWSDRRPGERRGNLPPWDRWGNSPDADRTLRAGEQDGSAQNRRARSAGSSPSLI